MQSVLTTMFSFWQWGEQTTGRVDKKYNWRPDLHDLRDQKIVFPLLPLRLAPRSVVDLRNAMPPVYDQQSLGSCTANAIAAAYEFDETSLAEKYVPSRLFIYYNERFMEGNVEKDTGASIRDGIKSIAKQGVCHETDWPYEIAKFRQRPSDSCYEKALSHRAIKYFSLNKDLEQMKACLQAGFPFVFGFSVYESFESKEVAETGQMPMPEPGEKLLGGHAVLGVGYDDEKRVLIVRNSWGDGWGDKGYFYMPYAFIEEAGGRMVADFWTVQRITN